RAARRPEPALARTRRALPGSAAAELLSALFGPAAEGLARGSPGAVGSSIELLLGGRVAVLGALPVLGVVLPRGPVAAGAAGPIGGTLADPVSAVDVPVEVVLPVHVDVDVAATPVAPAPDRAADDHPDTERDRRRGEVAVGIVGRVVVVRRIVRIRPRSVDDLRVVGRHVEDLRIRRLDLNERLLLG